MFEFLHANKSKTIPRLCVMEYYGTELGKPTQLEKNLTKSKAAESIFPCELFNILSLPCYKQEISGGDAKSIVPLSATVLFLPKLPKAARFTLDAHHPSRIMSSRCRKTIAHTLELSNFACVSLNMNHLCAGVAGLTVLCIILLQASRWKGPRAGPSIAVRVMEVRQSCYLR